jgi:hypothetical protein
MPATYIQALINQNAVLVHCSSQTVLVGDAYTRSLGPLERIQKALLGNSVVSSSTVTVNDQAITNYSGCIGIIISPKLPTSITHANYTDAGSTPSLREQTRTNGSVCSVVDFENSITNRSGYNEIFIHTYKTHGIFISRIVQFNINGNLIEFSDKEIYSAFPAQDFYQCINGEFYSLTYDSRHNNFVPVKSTYP